MITDSGSNMVCAFRNDFDEDAPSDTDELEDLQTVEDSATDCQLGYSRLSCFIHTLLLCLKKFEARKIFANLIAKIRTLVSKFTSSQVLTGELLKLSGLKLVGFSNTRWNTVILVIQRLLKVKISVRNVLHNCGKQKYDLSDTEWATSLRIQEFLYPFNKYTDMSRTEGIRPLSEVVMMIKDMKQHLEKFYLIHNFITVSKEIHNQLDISFGHYFSESGSLFEGVYLSSTFLDPRYRIGLQGSEIDLAKKFILNTNWSSTSAVSNTSDEGHEGPQGEATLTADQSSIKKRKFEILEMISTNRPLRNSELSEELNSYAQNLSFDIEDDKADPWAFWNRHIHSMPKLAPIALDILSIPISIGHVERVFSIAGIATCGRRNRLKGANLEREVFLNKNKHLFPIIQ